MNGAVSYPGRPLLRRGDYGDRCFDLCRLAPRQRRSRGQVDRPPVRCPGGGLSLPATARPRLLLPPLAQPLPPPRSDRPQGGPDRPPARRQSLRRLCPAGALLQGGRPGRPPAPRRPRSWQAPAALRRRHRPVPRRAPRGDPLRPARLHPPRLGRVRLAYGLAPLPQEVRPGSSQPRRGVAHARRGCSRGPCDRADRRARPGRRAAHRGRASAATASGIFFAPTQYAGAFLLLPRALDWLAVARDCFADDYGSLACGLLTSVFAPVIGLKRLFHLDQMEDRGFAVLSGGRTCPTRHTVGGWRRHLRWYEVDAFCRRTSPWEWVRGDDALVSFDEHTLPRWTRKYALRKGYVTTRNKYMRCEKLFYGYHVELERYLCVQATPGHVALRDLAVPLTRRVLTAGRPRHLHALFDAGAGKADADVRALLRLAAAEPNLTVTLRACRYPHRVRVWKQLPSSLFVAYEEPGPWVGAPPKEIRLAETATILKGEGPEEAVRTVVCREVVPGPKKDRWHPLYTSGE